MISERRNPPYVYILPISPSLFSKHDDYFLVFYPLAQVDRPQMIKLRPPCAPHQSNLLAYTSFAARACFWLVVVFDFPVRSHLRPQPILFSIFYSPSIHRSVRRYNNPPHVPPRSRLLSNNHPTVDDDFQLIVVFPH